MAVPFIFAGLGSAPVSNLDADFAYVLAVAQAALAQQVQFGVSASTNSVVPCSTIIPFDNTIPQITEGTQVLSVTITPLNAASTIEITYSVEGSSSTAMSVIGCVFQDTTVNALTGSLSLGTETGPNMKFLLTRTFTVLATTIGARTYFLRVGPGSSGTFYVNGDKTGAGLFGGALTATIVAREIVPSV